MLTFHFLLPFFMFITGAFVVSSSRKHLLVTLLGLELIVLSLFMLLTCMLNMYNAELYFTLVFLVFSVCEGSLGLSILVSIIRTHGNDYFNSFNALKF